MATELLDPSSDAPLPLDEAVIGEVLVVVEAEAGDFRAILRQDVGQDECLELRFTALLRSVVGRRASPLSSRVAAWTGRGSVDSFVSAGPLQSAARDLRQAINAMVGRTWL
jgi:hypothetical protein